jgi:hypothetical protein
VTHEVGSGRPVRPHSHGHGRAAFLRRNVARLTRQCTDDRIGARRQSHRVRAVHADSHRVAGAVSVKMFTRLREVEAAALKLGGGTSRDTEVASNSPMRAAASRSAHQGNRNGHDGLAHRHRLPDPVRCSATDRQFGAAERKGSSSQMVSPSARGGRRRVAYGRGR